MKKKNIVNKFYRITNRIMKQDDKNGDMGHDKQEIHIYH